MATRGKRTKRRSTARRRKTSRASTASRGKTVLLSVAELKRLVAAAKRKKGKRKGSKSSARYGMDWYDNRVEGTESYIRIPELEEAREESRLARQAYED